MDFLPGLYLIPFFQTHFDEQPLAVILFHELDTFLDLYISLIRHWLTYSNMSIIVSIVCIKMPFQLLENCAESFIDIQRAWFHLYFLQSIGLWEFDSWESDPIPL